MDPFDPKESTEESFKLMCLLPVKYGLLKHPLLNSCFGHYGPWPLSFKHFWTMELPFSFLVTFFLFCFVYFIVR
ncbi:hypothetical protein N7519_011777 [Penicillium mononematosum]|uniref:uncharacterized protein n=1 Tax=Penicillium mononematosum TaxID=268346 RepID=UPI0025493373|nr:uncharacterized protein N7519_011777 [Penicillium mononematosum]KAJ6181316.1 hypothetical protein N7519_011777 [Penicillium mononematosum]